MQRETLLMADRLGDSRSKAYALAAEIIVSTIFAPKPLNEFEILRKKCNARRPPIPPMLTFKTGPGG